MSWWCLYISVGCRKSSKKKYPGRQDINVQIYKEDLCVFFTILDTNVLQRQKGKGVSDVSTFFNWASYFASFVLVVEPPCGWLLLLHDFSFSHEG